MPQDENHKTALVLAGGGSLGAIQVGMLKALAARGIKVDMVVGSSVGAINGAYYAADPTVAGSQRLERLWRGMSRSDIFPVHWRSMLGFLARRDFLVTSDGIRRLVTDHLPYRNLEDAPVPVHVVATDVLTGAPVVLSSGDAADAIVASTAIPAAFPPVRYGDRYLMDGAITSNTPVRIAVSLGARRLLVLPTGFACNRDSPPAGALGNALHALTLLIARQLVAELEGLPASIDFAIFPSLCPLTLTTSPYDFSHTGEMIEAAEAAALGWIDSGGLATREIPDGLRAHGHTNAGAA